MSHLFARANRKFPSIWLSPAPPNHPFGNWREDLVGACASSGAVVDVTHSTGLWGDLLPREGIDLMVCIGRNTVHSTSASHAADLVQADLVQVLSCLGGRRPLLVFWNVIGPHEDFQIEGALAGFEEARQDEIFRHLGLNVAGPALAAIALWQFNDAFDAVLVANNPLDRAAFEDVSALANQRGVGVVVKDSVHWRGGISFADMPSVRALPNAGNIEEPVVAHHMGNSPVLVPVNEAAIVARWLALQPAPIAEFDAVMGPFADAYRNAANWEALARGLDPAMAARAAAVLETADWLDREFA